MGDEDLMGNGKDEWFMDNIDGGEEEYEEYQLPGFRFHPTDEELVSFYLRRKLDKKPINIELIKQIDIYKYDPWDLPKGGSSGGDLEKEWYFFCKRGRKYRNSIRPNRVTGSGFWKATGIDKPVYSDHHHHHINNKECNHIIIGLKKTLVYYTGTAGKGTKTDWMMHEFRLPSNSNHHNITSSASIAQQAEIWTLCRIFKRNNVSKRKHIIPDWRSHIGGNYKQRDKSTRMNLHASAVATVDCDTHNNDKEAYINFGGNNNNSNDEHEHYYYYYDQQKPSINNNYNHSSYNIDERNHFLHQMDHHLTMGSQVLQHPQLLITPPASAANDFFTFDNWDELGSVVKLALI